MATIRFHVPGEAAVDLVEFTSSRPHPSSC
jgi:hypothetical protein